MIRSKGNPPLKKPAPPIEQSYDRLSVQERAVQGQVQHAIPEIKREFRARLRLKAYKLPKYPRPTLEGI